MRTSESLSELEMKARGPSANFGDKVLYGVADAASKVGNYFSRAKEKISKWYIENVVLPGEFKLAVGEYSPYALVSDIAHVASSPVGKGAGVVTASGLLCACPPCPGPNPPTPIPEPTPDTIAPVVSINRENPYEVYVGDDVPYMLGVSANDETDGNITDRVSYSPEIGEKEGVYSVTYKAKDNAGNEGTNTGDFKRITEDGLAKLFDDFYTLIPNPAGGFYTPREAIENMTFAGSKFELPRGSNDNVADNIEGSYLVTGSLVDSLENTHNGYSYGVELSKQNGFSVDKFAGSSYNYLNSVLTGSADKRVGVSHECDYYGDNSPESVSFSNITIIENGNFQVDTLELFLSDDGTNTKWIRLTEDYIKQ